MDGQTFEWDEDKNRENQAKHGVSFMDAIYAFEDPHRVIYYDHKHSIIERRYICPGFDKAGTRVLSVRYTYRKGRVRIIGAGYWHNGRKAYAKKSAVQG